MDAPEVRALVAAWCADHPSAVVYDEAGGALLDVFSGKTLDFDAGAVEAAEKKRNEALGGAYVVVLRDDGRQLVLAAPGIAWAPSTASTGPRPELPDVVCWRDFEQVTSQLSHRLEAHREEGPAREDIDAVVFGIAVLDGARALGFEVSREERRLEALLARIEA